MGTSMKTLQAEMSATHAAVDRPTNYCANGTVPFALPGLEVAGLGSVALPLKETAAKELNRPTRRHKTQSRSLVLRRYRQ